MSYLQQRKWADQFINQNEKDLASYFHRQINLKIKTSSPEEDMRKKIDFKLFIDVPSGENIALRTRSLWNYDSSLYFLKNAPYNHNFDLTIRFTKNGKTSEYDELKNLHWYLYGYANCNSPSTQKKK